MGSLLRSTGHKYNYYSLIVLQFKKKNVYSIERNKAFFVPTKIVFHRWQERSFLLQYILEPVLSYFS